MRRRSFLAVSGAFCGCACAAHGLPERVAGWDKAVAEIRASNGRLPQRA